ncbi:hypothetical protein [Clostridium sp. Marseille-P2415]|uniref:hypothetical protein n=1 Tax=Clostridium sp. Marseille-P2415 TaxID=1805471 RepID=UPI0009885BAD|nr:hypothetical protein [Clostridium sp. Marseille-P2415]
MAYSAGNRLPFESASKLGHLNVIESEWVKSLIDDFEIDDLGLGSDINDNIWDTYDSNKEKVLQHIWVVDGSYVPVQENNKEVAFVKTALMTIEQSKIAKIDKEFPHPLQLQEIMKNSALFHSTVFPLKNIKSGKGNIYDTVRHSIFDSIKIEEQGLYFETLKWLVYEKWNMVHKNSPDFQCPHCGLKIDDGIGYDKDVDNCKFCGKEVLLTDMIGFHLDMSEDSAPVTVASSYMMIMEMLMLFTVIRLHWESKDKNLVSETLYIKDGPMTLGGQYAKLVPCIRNFLDHAKRIGRPIHIMGCEKSGKYFDYLHTIERFIPLNDGEIKYAVLSHDFIRKEIQRAPEHINPYGSRTNYGEKVFVILDKNTQMVLNMSPGEYISSLDFPKSEDIMGLGRILATLPSLISRKYEGALYPIELVNGIASMSNYPSAKILQDFVRDTLK